MIVANEYEKANINSNIEKKISKLRKHSYIPLGSKNFNFMHSVNDFYPEDTLKSKSEIEEMTTDCNYSGKESLLTKNDSYCDSVDIENYKKNCDNNKSAFNRVNSPFYSGSEAKFGKQVLFTSIKNKKNESFKKIDNIREVYYDLLLSAAEGCIDKGIISLEEIYLNNGEIDDEIIKCENKACTITANRNSLIFNKVKNFKSKPVWLCQECFKAYKNSQYCCYCNTIYRDNCNESYIDNKSWIQCDYCELWHHIQCEEQKGIYGNIFKLINDPHFKYMCLPCRNKSSNGKNITKRKYRKDQKSLIGNKRKNENGCMSFRSIESNDFKTYSNYSILNSNDSRDIYHDFYKIANINHNGKH